MFIIVCKVKHVRSAPIRATTTSKFGDMAELQVFFSHTESALLHHTFVVAALGQCGLIDGWVDFISFIIIWNGGWNSELIERLMYDTQGWIHGFMDICMNGYVDECIIGWTE